MDNYNWKCYIFSSFSGYSIIISISFENCFFNAVWEAGDLLGYIAGFETLVATAFLGFIALSQTERIKEDDEFNNMANTKRPFLAIEKITFKDENKNEVRLGFNQNSYYYESEKRVPYYIYLKNLGEGVANECTYSPVGFGTIPDSYKPLECIPIDGEIRIPFSRKIGLERINIDYRNILGFRYRQVIILDVTIKNEPCNSDYVEIDSVIQHVTTEYKDIYCTKFNLISSQESIGLDQR